MKLFALNRVYFAAQSSSYERPIHLAALTDFWSAARHFSVAGTLVRMGCDKGPGGKGFGNSRPLGKFGACLTGYTWTLSIPLANLDHFVTDSPSYDACQYTFTSSQQDTPRIYHPELHHVDSSGSTVGVPTQPCRLRQHHISD